MSQDTWNFIFIGLSFALYIGIALRQRAGSTSEYYTAGGGVSPFANGMATAADWMSAATFISMAGLIASKGFDCRIGQVYYSGKTLLVTTFPTQRHATQRTIGHISDRPSRDAWPQRVDTKGVVESSP